MGVWHVMPRDDFREHEPYKTCWCNPIEGAQEPDLWLHNAMDGREQYEEGRKPS